MEAGPGVSPSFNSYFNSKFAELAARVVGEFDSQELMYDEFNFGKDNDTEHSGEEIQNSYPIPEADAEEDREFEFTFVAKGSELFSPISAGEIFLNGQIRPVYPVFNRELLTGHGKLEKETEKEIVVRNLDSSNSPKIRLPLRKLFFEERETALTTSSSSSSEADNLEGLPAETYCLWQPKKSEEAENRCKKSSSSCSRRWKFSDLLHRSHSDGSKDRFAILSPSNMENEDKVKQTQVGGGKFKTAPPPLPRPHNRNGGEKRRSYLPYRQELVGFFGNVNGIG